MMTDGGGGWSLEPNDWYFGWDQTTSFLYPRAAGPKYREAIGRQGRRGEGGLSPFLKPRQNENGSNAEKEKGSVNGSEE